VPALSSSPISAALEQLGDLSAGDRVLLAGEWPSLAGCLQQVPDPRDPRGIRHSLTSLLLAAVAAVLAGAQSLAAPAPEASTVTAARREPGERPPPQGITGQA
jgi:hypothetical protein